MVALMSEQLLLCARGCIQVFVKRLTSSDDFVRQLDADWNTEHGRLEKANDGKTDDGQNTTGKWKREPGVSTWKRESRVSMGSILKSGQVLAELVSNKSRARRRSTSAGRSFGILNDELHHPGSGSSRSSHGSPSRTSTSHVSMGGDSSLRTGSSRSTLRGSSSSRNHSSSSKRVKNKRRSKSLGSHSSRGSRRRCTEPMFGSTKVFTRSRGQDWATSLQSTNKDKAIERPLGTQQGGASSSVAVPSQSKPDEVSATAHAKQPLEGVGSGVLVVHPAPAEEKLGQGSLWTGETESSRPRVSQASLSSTQRAQLHRHTISVFSSGNQFKTEERGYSFPVGLAEAEGLDEFPDSSSSTPRSD